MKILICVPVYNRKLITTLVLDNLNRYKKDATLWVYNDWSTEYDSEYLEPYCDRVIKLPKSDKLVIKNESNKYGMGVQHLRWYQLREFLKTDFDAIYFTDSDAIHDPSYIDKLKELNLKYTTKNGIKLPICLYSTQFHLGSGIKENNEVYVRKTAPGISQFFTRDMVSIIVDKLNSLDKDPDYAWDYKSLELLNLPIITTKTSYIEHFGADKDSMHSKEGEWDRDRALHPTSYLVKLRGEIISYIESGGENKYPEL